MESPLYPFCHRVSSGRNNNRFAFQITWTLALFLGLALCCLGCQLSDHNQEIGLPSNLVYPQTTIAATVGQAILADTPTVSGTGVSYTVSPTLPSGLALNTSTGAISGTPTAITPQATYTITASNHAGNTSATIQISVNAVLTPPTNLVYPQTSITATVGKPISVDTPTVSGTVDSYTVSPDLPAGLTLNTSTGAISGTPTAVTPQTAYTITAANPAGSTTATVQIAVNAALMPPSNLVYPQTSITATVGQAIPVDTPTVTGTVGSYTVSPALPAGLTLNGSTGVISGTPTAVTPKATYTITAANQAGHTSATVQIVVNAALVLPTNLVYPQTSISANVGKPIAVDTPTVNGTVSSYTVSPALPAGLALNTSSGAISGTPTAVTPQATYTITASNQLGHTSATIQIVVNIAPPSNLMYSQTNISTAVGAFLDVPAPTVTGTVDSFTIYPPLPWGLHLNASTGTISGNPTMVMSQHSLTVTASNQAGSTSETIHLVIYPFPPPTYISYPVTSITAYVGQPIPVDTPMRSGGGSSVSYTASPNLPTGLTLDSSTGVISGTPTAVTPLTTYTIRAANEAGGVSEAIHIEVKAGPAPPTNLTYRQTTITTVVGQAIPTNIPAVTGTVTSFTSSPELPAGLTLNSANGAISGTPTATEPQATYTITAANGGGNTSATVQITVNHALNVLLDLGHSTNIRTLRMSGSRILSQDDGAHWVLWDYTSGKELSNGDAFWPKDPAGGGSNLEPWPVDIAGPIFVIGVSNGLEVRSSSDGSLLTTIASSDIDSLSQLLTHTDWKLASDGSYICTASKNGLAIWTPGGQLIASRPGDYSGAKIFAAPGQILVAMGPAGQNVIETISASDGTSVVGPAFSGQFFSWFLDGKRFLTKLSDTVWVYSNTTVQQSILSLPNRTLLGGLGDWFWTYGWPPLDPSVDPLEIYSVGSTSPVATYGVLLNEKVVASGTTLSFTSSVGGEITVVDLSGQTPSVSNYVLPVGILPLVPQTSTYAAISSSQWVMGNGNGVILDGSSPTSNPRYFGLGKAWSIAGSSNRTSIATASGTILYFDPSNTTPEGTINFPSGKIALSDDGTVLAAFGNGNPAPGEEDRTLNIYSLPANSLTYSFPAASDRGPDREDFTLSSSGTILGQILNNKDQVTGISGSPLIWSYQPAGSLLLSPDATLIAVSSLSAPDSVTKIWQNGNLVTAISGNALGWINNSQILINNLGVATIYTFNGTKIPTPTLPELQSFRRITDDTFYSPDLNTVFPLTSGQPVWNDPYPFAGYEYPKVGAVSGPYVVFERGSYVFTDQYQLQN